jgi:hypothetical protein
MSDIILVVAVVGGGYFLMSSGVVGATGDALTESIGGVGGLLGTTADAAGGLVAATGGLLTSGVLGVTNLGHEIFDKGGAIDRTADDVKNTTGGLIRFVGAGGLEKTGDKLSEGIRSIKIPQIPKPKIKLPKIRLFK